MTFAGIAYAAFVMINFIIFGTKKKSFIHVLIMDATINLLRINFGYFAEFRGEELMLAEVSLLTSCIVSLFYIGRLKINYKVLIYSSALFMTTVCGLFMLSISPSEFAVVGYNNSGWDGYMRGAYENKATPQFELQNIKMLIRTGVYIYLVVVVWSLLNKEDWKYILKKLNKIFIFYLIICFSELILKRGIGIETTDLLAKIFGLGRSTGVDLGRLQGLSREPSYFAIALFFMSLVFILNYHLTTPKQFHKSKSITIMILLSILAVQSGSLSAVAFIFAILLYFLSFKSPRKIMSALLIVSIVSLIIVLITPYVEIFQRIFDRIMLAQSALVKAIEITYDIGIEYSSELTRIVSIVESAKAIVSRPIFGLGIGSVYSTSGLISIVASVGALGFMLWTFFLFRSQFPLPILRVVAIILPFLFLSDTATFYDTAFMYLVPLINLRSYNG